MTRPPRNLPAASERVHQWWAGTRDGRRSARRLSHLGAHVWLTRREREQSALNSEAARCVDRYTHEITAPRAALIAALRAPYSTADDSVVKAQSSGGMAQVRAARRRRAQGAARRTAEQQREERAAAATSRLDALIESTAAELLRLQAHHTLLFATYTRAYVRAYSGATTAHAPEPEWMLHIARREAISLTQSVLRVEREDHAA